MDLKDTADQAGFRSEVRTFLENELPSASAASCPAA